MKIALYIEDGLEQIVLTPESKNEDGILGKLTDGSRELSIRKGEFYACQGGWTRWRQPVLGYAFSDRTDESTIIVLRPAQGTEARRAATAKTGAVHESAVPNGETPQRCIP